MRFLYQFRSSYIFCIVSVYLALFAFPSFSFQHGSSCVLDPNNPSTRFRLLDPSDGIPFTNVNGDLRKALGVLPHLPEYRFSKVIKDNYRAFEVKLNSSYVALFESGRVGFTRSSSSSSPPAIHKGEAFLTSIFTVSCDGTISIQLSDDIQYEFAYHSTNQTVFGRPGGALKRSAHRRQHASLHEFSRRAESTFADHIDSWEPFNFLAGPVKVSDHDQIGWEPRCPPSPFGLQASVKPGARPASFNGCGAENGMKVPDFRFTICCDNHDLCYDNCGMAWEDCNENFRTCMHRACDDAYATKPSNDSDLTSYPETWSQWGCHNVADTYADVVGTRLGAWAFYNSNYDRCECNCPTGTTNCTEICLKDCSERCSIVDCSKETHTPKISSISSTKTTSSTTSTKTASSAKSSPSTSSTKTTSITTSTKTSSTTTSATLITTKSTKSPTPFSPTNGPAPPQPSEASSGGSWWWPFGSWTTTTSSPSDQEKIAKGRVTTLRWWSFG